MATAESPTAPPPAVNSPEAAASAAAASAPPIHVTASGITDSGPAPAPPRRGSARERMIGELRKKTDSPPPEPHKPAEPAKTAEAEPDASSGEPAAEATDIRAAEEQQAAAPTVEGKDKKKVSPWKLVDEYKGRAAKLEAEIAEIKKTVVDPKEKEALSSKLTAAEKRLEELEGEMRFTNYAKSKEFYEKYEKPNEEAWKRAMSDLGELTVADERSGEQRPISANDLLELVNMPLQQARAKANETYGDFADDVMAHRKEIRRIFDDQNRALDEARKLGREREEQQQRKIQEYQQTTIKQLGEIWTKANQEIVSDEKVAKYFKPIEGDEDGNKRLTRGYEMADKAFAADPRDPRLKPEDRAAIVRLHAAVRNRAAAFGRLAAHYEKSNAEIAKLKAELAKYKGAQPGTAAQPHTDQSGAGQTASARSQVFGALRQRAH